MLQRTSLIVLLLLGIIAGFALWNHLARPTVLAPSSTVAPVAQSIASSTSSVTLRQIEVTNGVKHSVPLDEIVSGGPPPDGILPIDHPKFISVDEASKLLPDDEIGLALDYQGKQRFYPFQILVWHEIVNDMINGQRVLLTYCPLCRSGIVFDPVVNGERVEFGTSGKLWNSNLVMYDRKTKSLWSQVLGESIVGPMTGAKLTVLPSDITRFGLWKRAFSHGEVLSRNAGEARDYGTDPYGNYYTTPGTYFPVNHTDSRLGEKELILGIIINGHAKAYYSKAIEKLQKVEDSFQGKIIVAVYDKDVEVVRLFEKKPDGTLMRLNPVAAYWFSWAAAHPDTELYK